MAPNTLDPVTKPSDNISPDEDNSVRSRLISSEGKTFVDSTKLSHSKEITENNEVNPEENTPFVPEIRWPDLIAQLFIHGGSIYGLYYLITLRAAFYTYVWCKSIKTLL